MKKFVSVILMLSMMFGISIVTYANSTSNTQTMVITDKEYGYSYTKTVKENGRIVSTYINSNIVESSNTKTCANSEVATIDYNKTKSLLIDLGMNESVVSNFNENDLKKYASAKSILTISTIINEYNDDNQNSENVSNDNSRSKKPPTMEDIGGDDGGEGIYEGFVGGNVNLLLSVADLGEGLYDFSITAVHKTAPTQQISDCIGISASYMTVENNTRSGYVNYTNSSGQTNCFFHFGPNNFHNASNGNWYGSAATFSYKDNLGSTETSSIIAFYTYKAKVVFPDQAMNFQVTGTYDHLITIYSIEPSISISLGSNSEYSIGYTITSEEHHELKFVDLPSSIYYDPNN